MLRPKRRRWVNEKYTRWVKTQPCACCGKPADDPHHLIGHGQGGMGTKAHDLFVLKELCQHCHGKGEVSTACRGCKGKGIVLDEKRTRLHGTPVYKICGRCNGNRFSRLPTTLARHHVQKLVPDLTDYQWYKGYADVIDKLVTKCWQEEAYAEIQLRNVTR